MSVVLKIVTSTEKYLDTKIEGYNLVMEFNSNYKNEIKVFDASKDINILSMVNALQILKSDKYELEIYTNFLDDDESLNTLLSKKKNKKLLKLVEGFTISKIEKIKDDDYELMLTQLQSEVLKCKELYTESYNRLINIDKLKDLTVLEKVERSPDSKVSTVKVDEFTDIAKLCFDYEFTGISEFKPFNKPKNIPKDFNIGVIVGASGTGKSTLLKEFGNAEIVDWNNERAIISHFDNPKQGIDKLSAVGLNSVPSWVKPYEVLSTGEKFRANLARVIHEGSVIDEFTSVVDRDVAKATSTAFSKYVKNNDIKNIVIATCHEDILDWLEPDWVFNTNSGLLYDGASLRRPTINLEIYETKDYELWETFKSHHYLSVDLNKASRKFLAMWNGKVIGFSATMPLPSGTLKNAWRGHRTVILPEFQGLGLGVRFSDTIGQIHLNEGKRYFSKTSHIRMGEYREKSELWKATSKNKKRRTDMEFVVKDGWKVDQDKISFSHEYIGIN